MAYTIYVSDWEKQPNKKVKVLLSEKYDAPNDIYLDYVDNVWTFKDEVGNVYEYETVYENPFPELEIGVMNWADISSQLGFRTYEGCGKLELGEIPSAIQKCIKILNSQKQKEKLCCESYEVGNWHFNGRDENYVDRKISKILEILKFAQENQKSIYWC